MPKPLSADVRDRFRGPFEAGLSGREAARRLLISAPTASRLARRLMDGWLFAWQGVCMVLAFGRLRPCSEGQVPLVRTQP